MIQSITCKITYTCISFSIDRMTNEGQYQNTFDPTERYFSLSIFTKFSHMILNKVLNFAIYKNIICKPREIQLHNE